MDTNSPEYRHLLKYYLNGKKENPRFFSRLGTPSLQGLRVLDVGCGTGSLAAYMADELGAAHVTGCDFLTENIDFAQSHLAAESPHLTGRVEYVCSKVEELAANGEKFDAIISKDALEHIIDFRNGLESIKSLLKPDGRFIAGWGPLFYSPKGGHALTRHFYDHLLPTDYVISRFNRARPHEKPITSIAEYGLNQLSYRDYVREFKHAGFIREFWGVDRCEHLPGRVAASFARMLPEPLCEPFIFNVYAIMKLSR